MKKVLAFGIVFTPMFALAQSFSGTYISGMFTALGGLLDTAVLLVLALGVVFFLWNVAKFVMAGGDEEGKNEGRKGMISGLIGIAVMVSLWGLVNILTNVFGASTTGSAPSAPKIPK